MLGIEMVNPKRTRLEFPGCLHSGIYTTDYFVHRPSCDHTCVGSGAVGKYAIGQRYDKTVSEAAQVSMRNTCVEIIDRHVSCYVT